MSNLVNQSPASEEAVRSIFKELQQHGYVRRVQHRREDGTFAWITDVFEQAQPPQADDDKSLGNKPSSGQPHMVEPRVVDRQIKEVINNTFAKITKVAIEQDCV